MRKMLLAVSCCCLLLGQTTVSESTAEEPRRKMRPNVVLILADDMGYGDLGSLNPDSRISTPNLDRLAQQSITFTDAHAAGSYCVPSRYGLLTGRYMWRTRLGSGGNLANFGGTLIEPGRKTVADVLHAAGYYTGLVGKWHQGIDWKLRDETDREVIRNHRNYQDFENIDFTSPVLKGPNDFGFDYSFGTAGSAEMNPSTFIENNRATIVPTLTTEEAKKKHGEWYGRDDNIIAADYTMDRLVPTLSKKACEFVEAATRTRPQQPFFLYYAMTTPHNPIVPNREFVGTSKAGTYGDFVVELDHHVGKLLQTIKKLGIEENTIVIFTSDNGPVNRTNGYAARWVRGDTAIYGHDSTGPFAGWKAGLQEGGHRVPFLVRWPKKIKAGEKSSTTIQFTDVLPTLAEILNVRLDDNTAEDGRSFYPALVGAENPVSFHEAIVHNNSSGTFALRQGDFKLTVLGPKTTEQLLDDTVPARFKLHHLADDIEETTDVSRDHPAKVKAMHALLRRVVREGRSNKGK